MGDAEGETGEDEWGDDHAEHAEEDLADGGEEGGVEAFEEGWGEEARVAQALEGEACGDA